MEKPRSQIEVAVLIVSYNSKRDLEECIPSVLHSHDPGISTRLVLVDNASTDGSAELVAQRFAQVDLLISAENRGFAGGNNLGWQHISLNYPNVKYLCLLNPDTIVKSGWLTPLVDYIETNDQIASVQPKVMLHPQTDRFNTVGNQSHFLGFGLVSAYGQVDRSQYDCPSWIDYASGAAMIVRVSLLHRFGLFEEEMFMYLEDADLSWKLRQSGWKVAYVPHSVVYHKYVFSNHRYYYYFERNRWWLLLTYYKVATLILLWPALMLMEIGQWYFAWRNRVLPQKVRSYAYFLHTENQLRLRRLRQKTQSRRVISDRLFMANFTSRIDLPQLETGWAGKLANWIFSAYWSIAKRLIFW